MASEHDAIHMRTELRMRFSIQSVENISATVMHQHSSISGCASYMLGTCTQLRVLILMKFYRDFILLLIGFIFVSFQRVRIQLEEQMENEQKVPTEGKHINKCLYSYGNRAVTQEYRNK